MTGRRARAYLRRVATKSQWMELTMACYASVGGILVGYESGCSSFLNLALFFGNRNSNGIYALSSSEETLLANARWIGLFLGALLSAPIADSLGRRKGMLAACIIFTVGVLAVIVAPSLSFFSFGRGVCNLALGVMQCIMPMYLAESSSKWMRGAVVSSYQWTINIGYLLSIMNIGRPSQHYNRSPYQFPLAIQFIWVGILAFGMATLPESPRFLIKTGNLKAAASSLSYLRQISEDDPYVQAELNELITHLNTEDKRRPTTYSECFKNGPNKIRLRTLTGIFLSLWQQLFSTTTVLASSLLFFFYNGVANPVLMTMSTELVHIGVALPTFWLISKAGRRNLLLWGSIGLVGCQFLLYANCVHLSKGDQVDERTMIALIYGTIGFYAVSWGPVPLVVISEIFPLELRAKSISLSVASTTIFGVFTDYVTPYIPTNKSGNLDERRFLIWSFVCIGGLIFTYFCVPETSGLSLEQVDILYSASNPANSPQCRDKLVAQDTPIIETARIHPIADRHLYVDKRRVLIE